MAKRNRSESKQFNRRISLDSQFPDEQGGFEAFYQREDRFNPKPLRAKTEAQGNLMSQIQSKDLIFTTGPAGTGKTYVVTASAVEALLAGKTDKIIFTRPMVACDEEPWILPGEEDEKFAPWVSPMMDVIEERAGKSHARYLVKTGKVQFKPMMTMRGSSFKDSWVILDEAQNTTPQQMKMFLTRLGENSKMIVSGDIAQSDLKDGRGVMQQNGLADAQSKLRHKASIGFAQFTIEDCVRHGLVREILEVYEGRA